MSHHFRAYTFVDRITAVQPGVSVRGSYAIPAALAEFSGSLVAEATGQLAAWSALAAVDFKSRPVAGIAGLVEILAPVRPGDTLELTAEIESVDVDAISYGGTASVNGSPVLRLHHCVGPMLPAADFDDPQALRERYALLGGPGAAPGAFTGVPDLTLEKVTLVDGSTVRATLQVPMEAPFFSDHFPRRPVFPGTLLMQSKLSLVSQLAAQLPGPAGGGKWKLQNVSGMKLRAFIPPGDVLQLEAKLVQLEGQSATVSVDSRRNGKLAGAATITLSWLPIV
jgi:3-hydroxymyristoyl/3-hydroxydecanoyl-(acyl carrier protein) dehydratase